MKKIISAFMILAMLLATLSMAIPTFATSTVDLSDLQNLIKDVEAESEEKYTQETWEALMAELELAKAVAGEQAPTQEKVDAAEEALQAKYDALAEPTRDDLKAKIDAGKVFENEGFSAETWKKFEEALEAAEDFYEKNTVITNQLKAKLKTVYHNLVKALKDMKYDVTELRALVDKGNALFEANKFAEKTPCSVDGKNYKTYGSDFEKATYDPFVAALTTAKENIKSNNLELITVSTKELGDAIAALKVLPVPQELVDRNAELLNLADLLIPTDWPDAAWGMVEQKVLQAKEVSKNVKISTYVKAITQLETALKNLTNDEKTSKDVLPEPPVVNTKDLDDLIKWCDDNLVESGYTADSWRVLSEALTKAKNVSADPKKAEYVQSAYDRLNNARKALVAVEGGAAAGGDDANGEPTEVGCGGAIGATVVVMSAALALGATVVLKKKED